MKEHDIMDDLVNIQDILTKVINDLKAKQVKTCTLEEARAVLAEKSRSGHKEEVKALIKRHGAKQLSDIKNPAELAALVEEAEVIGNE